MLKKTLVGSILLASLALAGCGASPTMVDDPYADDPGYSDPGYTDPGYTDPGYGGGTTPGYTDPSVGGGYGAELSASVIKVKNGKIMGLGKCVATVEVMNPSQQQMSGTLTVTFTNKGKPTANVQTKQITLAAGESQTFDFEDKKWSTDNATAEITTDTPMATTPLPGAYGSNTGAYGSTTGSYGTQPAYGQAY
jgi:outer membrane lipoprotein SlyB